MATIQEVNTRLEQIQAIVAKLQQDNNQLAAEYQQLLGYRQAILDNQQPTTETVSENETKQILNESKNV